MSANHLTPAERSLWARAAAYRLHSLYDSKELTANARAAFQDRFAREVDPEGILLEVERQRRAECARKAYYSALAAKSAKARRQRKVGRGKKREVSAVECRKACRVNQSFLVSLRTSSCQSRS